MIKQSILVVLSFFILLTLIMYIFQRHLIYVPNVQHPSMSKYKANDMEDVWVVTKDGLRLHAWYKPAKGHQPTILFLHGNAGNIGSRMPIARPLMDAGFGMLLLEYRGYGGNAGKPTEQGFYEDARAGVRFLREKDIDMSHVVLYGESLGSAVATQLATEYSTCALILQSPFTSLTAMAKYRYPWVLIQPWDRYDSIDKMQHVRPPVLILHGKQDDVVPYTQGLLLFNTAHEPKAMVTFALGTHGNLWTYPLFWRKVLPFIHEHCSR